MSGQLRPRPDREPNVVTLLTLRAASIHPVIRPQAGRSEATEPKPWFVLLMRATRAFGTACKDRRPARLEVLDCFVPGFAQPMTFAPAPGVVFDGACGAYRRRP